MAHAYTTKTRNKVRHVADLRSIGGKEPTFKTLKLAEQHVENAIAEHVRSGYIDPASAPTFGEAMGEANDGIYSANTFLGHTQKRVLSNKIGNGELVNKARAIQLLLEMNYQTKKLRDVRVSDFRAGQLQLELIDQIERGRAYKTAKNTLVIFKQAIKFCVLRGYINVSPAHDLSIEQQAATGEDKRAKRIGKDRVLAIINAAPEKYKLVIKAAAHTGLRAGELCVLRWSDIDFDLNLLTVARAKKKGGAIGATKTKAGFRQIDLTPDLSKSLREWKLQQPIEQRCNDLVFANASGSVADTDVWRELGIKATCRKLGIEECTLHDMRHFFASILLFELAESEATITTLMGHSSIDFTRKQYGHWIAGLKRGSNLGEKLQAAFS